jgi:hypothetical protein
MFESLGPDQIRKALSFLRENHYSSSSIITTNGKTLFGDIEKDIIDDKIRLFYPDGSGTYYGLAYLVKVPIDRISSIQALFPYKEEGPESMLRNIPNPFSKEICEHNTAIIEELGLEILNYAEFGKSELSTTTDHISFRGYEQIYADWDYFSHISSGINSISLPSPIGGGVGWNASLQGLIYKKLTTTKHVKFFFSRYPEFNTEITILGQFLSKTELNIYLENINCDVFVVRIRDSELDRIPVIIKCDLCSYPIGLYTLISNPLTFYGELKQIPADIDGIHYEYTLLARAISFIP